MFKSKKEMARAMLDGKVIEFENGAIAYWDDADDCSPFVYNVPPIGKRAMNMAWDWYKTASIKQEWYDKVSKEKPRLCWVSDVNAENNTYAIGIVSKDDRYRSIVGSWKYATPVKPEELGE